ncbi:MAG: DUF4118 domain-containing protein, partial [Ralstonia mannitolilytica]
MKSIPPRPSRPSDTHTAEPPRPADPGPFSSSGLKAAPAIRPSAWLVAIGAAVLGTAVRVALEATMGIHLPFYLAFPVVTIAAWYGGFWPGMLAIGAYGTLFLAVAAVQTWAGPPPPTTAQVLVFSVGALLICVLCEQLRRARAGAERRALAETQQRLSQQRLVAALQASPISLYDVDNTMHFTWVHNAVFGLKPEQLLGRTVREVFGRRA